MTPTKNQIAIARNVMHDIDFNGVSLSTAVHRASQILAISPAAVCAALTIVQDFMAESGTEIQQLAA